AARLSRAGLAVYNRAGAGQSARPAAMSPRILPRPAHTVSRKDIDPDALKVLYRLKNHGFVAYLVGGGVRDLLLGRRPKDFDIGTSAHPQQVKRLFRNCFIIGRRFRLCHVRFGRKVVEVSTFRRQAEADEGDTLIRRDNTFGTPEEDAFRRDFTVNALFYDIATFSVIDYVGGLEDLDRRTIRTSGDPTAWRSKTWTMRCCSERCSSRSGCRPAAPAPASFAGELPRKSLSTWRRRWRRWARSPSRSCRWRRRRSPSRSPAATSTVS